MGTSRRLVAVCSHVIEPAAGTAAASAGSLPAALPASDQFCTDEQAEAMLGPALKSITDYYQSRGIFQGRFGFGSWPAIVVVDFAYGWTDEVSRPHRGRCWLQCADRLARTGQQAETAC